jgi:ppGpp synthetase/RelA/SpoT-type nucleotidyltranferase
VGQIREEYENRYQTILMPTAQRLQRYIEDCFAEIPRIDRISTRAKSPDRFMGKAQKKDEKGQPKYSDPLNQIQDQIGARIVCFYLSDVTVIAESVLRYFRPIEHQNIAPLSQFAFGYIGKHYVLLYPDEVIDDNYPLRPGFFELQIKTLFQHAWAEAEHDLFYKTNGSVDEEFSRKIAFTAAQAWGADKIFDELFARANLLKEEGGMDPEMAQNMF